MAAGRSRQLTAAETAAGTRNATVQAMISCDYTCGTNQGGNAHLVTYTLHRHRHHRRCRPRCRCPQVPADALIFSRLYSRKRSHDGISLLSQGAR